MRKKLLLLFICALVGTVGYVGATYLTLNQYHPYSPYEPAVWTQKYRYAANELMGVKFNNKNGRLFFDVSVNDKVTAAFFDSGCAFGACISQQVMSPDSAQIVEYVDVYNAAGELRSRFPRFEAHKFSIGGKPYSIESALIIEEKESYFGFGPIKHGRITLDYQHHKAAISSSPWPEEQQNTSRRQVFHFMTVEGSGEGYIIIPVSIAGQEYYAMVDTGAVVSVIDDEIADKMNARRNLFGRVELKGLQIGNFTVDLPSVAVHSQRAVGRGLDRDVMVTIGADVLCQYLVTIDYQQRLLVLER